MIELIEYLKGAYAIDNRRIAVIGFSMGGMGTWRLIARHPDFFSAAIIPGIGHYQTKAFIPALETARKWLRKRWL